MSGFSFELREHDALGRLGRFTTPRGQVITPALMPVINPNIQTITASEMSSDFGAQMVITNSYIINRSRELRERALKEGLNRLLDFDGPVMTDSGTFQMYFYDSRGRGGGEEGGVGGGAGGKPPKIDIDPLDIVRFQRDIGSTVGTILDVFSTPEGTREGVEEDAGTTLERAKASIAEAGEMGLALPVQGGVFTDLRTRCARDMSGLAATIHPIGGVVPLMEGYRYDTMARIVLAAKEGLTLGRPVHLFGCGHPMFMPMAAALGCDLFDSSAYAKYAADGRMLFPFGTRRAEELEEFPCACPACSTHEPAEVAKMEQREREEVLARHNLHTTFSEVRRIRNAIREGSLWELVEERSALHPALHGAFRFLLDNWKLVEPFEPRSKRRFMASTPAAALRPEVRRFYTRLGERYRFPDEGPAHAGVGWGRSSPAADRPPGAVLPAARTPLSRPLRPALARLRRAGFRTLLMTPLGPVPPELDEMYPFGQMVLAEGEPMEAWDRSGEPTVAEARLDELCAKHGIAKRLVWDGREEPGGFAGKVTRLFFDDGTGGTEGDQVTGEEEGASNDPRMRRDLERVSAVCDMQFGKGSLERICGGANEVRRLRMGRSKNTGKLRTVHTASGEHVLSMRAEDGFMLLKPAGAQNLHAATDPPALRVVVEDDSVPFNREGKSVFARFVKRCDPGLRPGDEVLVVDSGDALVAVGQARMNFQEMEEFTSGPAVDVRDGLEAEGGK